MTFIFEKKITFVTDMQIFLCLYEQFNSRWKRSVILSSEKLATLAAAQAGSVIFTTGLYKSTVYREAPVIITFVCLY